MIGKWLGAAVLALANIGSAAAQPYPNRPITLVVPLGVGGSTDVIGRLMGEGMRQHLGQPIIVENTTGAGGTIGGISLISIYFITNPYLLIVPMIGVGIAWTSILAMPYAILAGALPARKMGLYMGVFNFFITLPQIVNGIIGGPVVKHLYGSQAIFSLVAAGVFFLLAAFFVRFVDDADDAPHGISG